MKTLFRTTFSRIYSTPATEDSTLADRLVDGDIFEAIIHRVRRCWIFVLHNSHYAGTLGHRVTLSASDIGAAKWQAVALTVHGSPHANLRARATDAVGAVDQLPPRPAGAHRTFRQLEEVALAREDIGQYHAAAGTLVAPPADVCAIASPIEVSLVEIKKPVAFDLTSGAAAVVLKTAIHDLL